jgi:O-antigen ligase
MQLVRGGLSYLLAFSLILILGLYFLAENGRINAFATYLVGIAIIFMAGLGQINFRSLLQPVWVLAGLLLVYLVVAANWAAGGEGLAKHAGYALLIATFLLGLRYSVQSNPAFLTWFLLVAVACGTASAALSLQLHVALPDYQPLPEPRLYGFGRLNNPMISAVSYGFVLVCAVHLATQTRQNWHWALLLLAGVVLLAAIALTGTRVVWLAIAIAAGMIVAQQVQRFALAAFAGVLIGIGVLAIALLGWEEVTRRALSFRPEIWQEFLARTLAANIWIGAGSGSDASWAAEAETFKHAHSIFMSTFYYGGILGLVLLLGMLGCCCQQLRASTMGPLRNLTTALLAYGVTIGLFDGDAILTKIDQQWWLLWFPVGLVLCTVRASDDHPGA